MIRKMLMLAAALVVLAAVPASAQYGFGVNPGTVPPGGTFTASGRGCAPGSTVTITVIEGRVQRATGDVIMTITTTTDENGEFSVEIKLPADVAAGIYTVEARCPVDPNLDPNDPTIQGTVVDGELIFSSEITVVASGGGGGGGGGEGVDQGDIVRTGSDLNGLGLVGAGLLAVGGLVLVASKRRRPVHA